MLMLLCAIVVPCVAPLMFDEWSILVTIAVATGALLGALMIRRQTDALIYSSSKGRTCGPIRAVVVIVTISALIFVFCAVPVAIVFAFLPQFKDPFRQTMTLYFVEGVTTTVVSLSIANWLALKRTSNPEEKE